MFLASPQLPFVEPELHPLPDVPEQPQEEPTPHFDPPELIVVEEFEEPEFVPLEPPTIPAAPVAPRFGKPQVCVFGEGDNACGERREGFGEFYNFVLLKSTN